LVSVLQADRATSARGSSEVERMGRLSGGIERARQSAD
jgi:hypothetical protein